MVIDSSALVAMLFGKPDAQRFATAIEADNVRLIGAPTILETSIVIDDEQDESGLRELDLLVHRANIEIIAFSEPHFRIALQAFQRFGKGRHPARLNYGDCFSYALSKATGEPLLFKGNDFALTDIDPVLVE